MWWYRDRETEGDWEPGEATARADALVASLGSCTLGDDPLRGACVAMAVLVDHEFAWTDDTEVLRPSWQDAEALVQRSFASLDLSRLYNDFARDFGDGFTGRDDLSQADRTLVAALLDALRATEGLERLQRRPPPTAEVAPCPDRVSGRSATPRRVCRRARSRRSRRTCRRSGRTGPTTPR